MKVLVSGNQRWSPRGVGEGACSHKKNCPLGGFEQGFS